MPNFEATGNLVAWLFIVQSLALWATLATRWHRGHPPLPFEPREPVPWNPIAVGLALPATIVVQLIAAGEAASDRPAGDIQIKCLIMGLEFVVLMGLLAVGAPIRAADFGIRLSGIAGDVKIGTLGCLVAWAPVFAVNLLVEELGLRTGGTPHPFFEILEADPSAATLGWILLGAVVLAPLVEELLYRVILQGWLETRLAPWMAVLFVAFLFAGIHAETGRPDHLPLFPLALILGYVYHRTHSYAAVVVLHGAFNAANLGLALLAGAH